MTSRRIRGTAGTVHGMEGLATDRGSDSPTGMLSMNSPGNQAALFTAVLITPEDMKINKLIYG